MGSKHSQTATSTDGATKVPTSKQNEDLKQAKVSVNPNQTNTVTTAKRTSTTKVPTKQRRFSYNIDEKDIESGAEAIDKFKVTNHAGLEIKYAWVSQRGYYPDEPNKDNQDSYTIMPAAIKKSVEDTLPGTAAPDLAFFAVYDGHGKHGHLCSWFVRDNLPKQIFKQLTKSARKTAGNSGVIQALFDAHVETNEMLHGCERVEDKISGTTAVSVLLVNRTLFVSNVGDSRAVLLSTSDTSMSSRTLSTKSGKIRIVQLDPKPLSSDQTPYRKDERERVKKCGARVMSMDQIEGVEPYHENWGDLVLGENIDEGGDPPRVWSPNGDYPGTAFTRSLGDQVAEALGVYAEPEILEYELKENDKFVVIASDGVWEFLTNQMVADVVSEHWNDPLAACRRIVSMAYELWLQFEVRTDDITIIILSVSEQSPGSFHETNPEKYTFTSSLGILPPIDTRPPTITATAAFKPNNSPLRRKSATSSSPTLSSHNSSTNLSTSVPVASIVIPQSDNANLATNFRPVRRQISREKRKNVIVSQTEDHSEDPPEAEIDELAVSKSERDKEMIATYLQRNFLFQHLSAAQLANVVNVMRAMEVNAGDIVIKQGTPGDCFYIVDTGRYDVRVLSNSTAPLDATLGGDLVYTYEGTEDIHPGFGELSLMYGKPRAASVIAQKEGRLWVLDRRVFRRVVLRSTDVRKGIIRTLRKVELLKSLSYQQTQRMADLLHEDKYAAGSYIIREGDIGDTFYIIISGVCDCTKVLVEGGPETLLVQRKEYEYFGERALLTSEPRAANVIARTEVKVLCISRSAFDEVLGSLTDIINEDRLRRETLANAILEAPKRLQGIDLRAVISKDNLGPFLLGSFRSPKPNLSVRSFILSEAESLSQTDTVLNFVEIVRLVTLNQKSSSLVPRLHSASRDSNAIFLLYRESIAADLNTILTLNNRSSSLACSTDVQVYVTACIISALETLHSFGIIYRSIQPESIYIDSHGRVLLMDFKVSKICNFGAKTFTVCGATDYLAPEQISQIGHTTSVDIWALGVLLYEVAVGKHPFSTSQGEIATYTRIASFGTSSYPALVYPENVPTKVCFLIDQLVQVDPDNRLGTGPGGFRKLQRAAFFESVKWEDLTTTKSPLRAVADLAIDELVRGGLEPGVTEAFSKPYTTSGWDNQLDM